MNQKELQSYQLELLKTNPSIIKDIDNPTDEMKWFLIKEKSLYIQDITEFSEEMMNEIVSLSIDFIQNIKIDWSKIAEESILKGIKNTPNKMFSLFLNYILINRPITNKIALELCLKNVLYYTEDKIKKELSEKDKENIVENYLEYYIDKYNSKKHVPEILPKDLLINKNQWEKLIKNKIFTRMFFEREDTPINYREKFIDSRKGNFMNFCSTDEKVIRIEDFLYWFKKYYLKDTENFKEYLAEYLGYVNSKQRIDILKDYGYLIEHIKKPNVSESMAAIKCDPFNIKYIKKPSKKMIEEAISLNKDVSKILEETKEVCEVLNKKYKNKYPENYYFIKFDENLADEDNLIKTMIVKGKDMEKFMEQSFILSFGNLDDDKERKVSDCVEIKPITKEEIKVLKKFNLDDLETGYFNFDFDEEEENN